MEDFPCRLHRRSLFAAGSALAVTTALPALAKPTAADPAWPAIAPPVWEATSADPILAALAEDRRLYSKWQSLSQQLTDAEDSLRKSDPRPYGLIEWRGYLIGGSEIKSRRNKLLRHTRISRKKIEAEYKDARARYQAQLRAERKWYKRTGLEKLRARKLSASRKHVTKLARHSRQ